MAATDIAVTILQQIHIIMYTIERVREGAKKTRERAAGAQIAYDTSTEAMDRRMETQERNRAADEVLAEIKRRRNNK